MKCWKIRTPIGVACGLGTEINRNVEIRWIGSDYFKFSQNVLGAVIISYTLTIRSNNLFGVLQE